MVSPGDTYNFTQHPHFCRMYPGRVPLLGPMTHIHMFVLVLESRLLQTLLLLLPCYVSALIHLFRSPHCLHFQSNPPFHLVTHLPILAKLYPQIHHLFDIVHLYSINLHVALWSPTDDSCTGFTTVHFQFVPLHRIIQLLHIHL